MVEVSFPWTPRFAIFDRFGSFPSSMRGPIRSNVAPSRPSTRTFFSGDLPRLLLVIILIFHFFVTFWERASLEPRQLNARSSFDRELFYWLEHFFQISSNNLRFGTLV